ncbi:MAG: PLDc N-terminal domain-containing protein [Chthoniobacteraceae bacterium]|jgi:hypothetical protein
MFQPILAFLAVPLLGFLVAIFWIWMLIDCIKNSSLSDTEKIIWVLVILILNGLGALIYFFVARKKGGSI